MPKPGIGVISALIRFSLVMWGPDFLFIRRVIRFLVTSVWSVLDAEAFGNADFNIPDAKSTPVDAAAVAAGKKLLGPVGETFRLEPGESKDLRFLFTWFFPNRPMPEDVAWNTALNTNTPIIKNRYTNWFSSSMDVAPYLQKNLTRLSVQTFLFHDAYYKNSTIPCWLNQRLLMPVSTLATETSQ